MKPESVTIIPASDSGEWKHYVVDSGADDGEKWVTVHPVVAWQVLTWEDLEDTGFDPMICDGEHSSVQGAGNVILARSRSEAVWKAENYERGDPKRTEPYDSPADKQVDEAAEAILLCEMEEWIEYAEGRGAADPILAGALLLIASRLGGSGR